MDGIAYSSSIVILASITNTQTKKKEGLIFYHKSIKMYTVERFKFSVNLTILDFTFVVLIICPWRNNVERKSEVIKLRVNKNKTKID